MNFKINAFFFLSLLLQMSLTFSSRDPLVELNEARLENNRDELQIWGEYWPDNFQSKLMPEAQAEHWLVVAAFIGDLERVKLYSSELNNLDVAVRIAARSLPIWNALMAAVIGNQPEIVKFLVLQGANKDKKIDDVYMEHQFTALWGRKIPDNFLKFSKNITDRTKAYSPLEIAKLFGNQQIINILENPQAPYVSVQQPRQQEPQKPIPVIPQKPTRVKQPEKILDPGLKIALEELNVMLLQLARNLKEN